MRLARLALATRTALSRGPAVVGAVAAGMTAMLVLPPPGAAHAATVHPATPRLATAAAAATADPPSSSSTAVSLIVNQVDAAGIPAFAGTYGTASTGSAGGTDSSTFPDPDGVLSYMTVASASSVTSGEPSIPTYYGNTVLTAISGPSLIPGGPELVDIAGLLHNFAQCTPPHAVMTDSTIVAPITFGHTLTDGVPVTFSVTGTQLGLPAVQDGTLTITMSTYKSSTDNTQAAVRTVITIDGTLNGTGGTELYSGPLATLTLGDVWAQCSTTASASADLQISKGGPQTAMPGDTVTYTLSVVNNGPDAASDVTVQDEVDKNLTGVTGLTSGCSLEDGTVTCDLGTMALGEVRDVTFSATVLSSDQASTPIPNCGTVTSSTPDPVESNNEDCMATTVESPPVPESEITDIAVKVTGPATVLPGGTVSYDITVSNNSSVDAEDVVLTDNLSPLLSNITSTDGCTLSGQTLTCEIGTLSAGGSEDFTVTGIAATDLQEGEAIDNSASVVTSTAESDMENNEDDAETTVGSTPPSPSEETDIEVAKTGQPDTVQPGGTVSYELTVSNNSSVDAHDVVLTDDYLSTQLSITSTDGCTLSGQTLTCDIGALPADAEKSFTVTGTAPADLQTDSSIENCASALSSTAESDIENNRACSEIPVQATPTAAATDLVVTKTGPATLLPGGAASYTLTVTNHGDAKATGVVVSDVLANRLGEVTRVPGGCTLTGRTLTCKAGTLAVGATRTFTVTATARQDLKLGTAVQNCDEAYSDTLETDYTNNAACVQALVRRPSPRPTPPRPKPSPTSVYPMPVGPAPTGGGMAPSGVGRPVSVAGLALTALGSFAAVDALRRRARRPRA